MTNRVAIDPPSIELIGTLAYAHQLQWVPDRSSGPPDTEEVAVDPSPDIRSRYYGLSEGETLDYTYEIKDDALTIWMGERNSPAYYEGMFSEDGNTLTDAWLYPGGGGYSTVTNPDSEHLRLSCAPDEQPTRLLLTTC